MGLVSVHIFAGDTKLCREINSPQNATYLLEDLDTIGDRLPVQFNVDQSKLMYLWTNNLKVDYSIGGATLGKSDLERIWESKLTPG